MNTNKVLEELAAYAGEAPVLSVYLDTDLRTKSKDAVRLMLRDQLRYVDGVPAELTQRVMDYIDFDYDWRARGLAIFANLDSLWETVPLPIGVATRVVWSDLPYIRPLTDVIDRFGAFNVALVNRESVRVFSVRMGEIQAQTEALGEELKRHRQGGWSAQIYQRREDNLAIQNLKQAAEVLLAFSEQTGVRRLVLGGSPEVLAQFREVMPRELSEQILGEFTADVSASAHKALQLSLDVVYQADLEKERRLVEEAITAARKGANGALGVADTIYALYQGRVRTLLINASFHGEAYVCDVCGSVSTAPLPECPLCGHTEVRHVADVANLAVHKAIETGAAIEIVRDSAELAECGGMAAILRY